MVGNKLISVMLMLCLALLAGCHRDTSSGFAEVNGTKLSYEIRGAGPALVLINDGILDRRMWDDQVAAFAKHYKVVRYDLRGWGNSGIPKEPYSNVDDLYRLLQLLRIDKAILLGSLVGSSVAIDFALEHPNMVERLVSVNPLVTGFPYSPATFLWIGVWRAVAQRGDVSRLIEFYMNEPTLGLPLKNDASARKRIEAILTDNFPLYSVDLGRFGLWFDPPAFQILPTIRVPTLVLVGERTNPDVRRIADVLEVGIQGARKVVIPQAGHLVNIEKPEEFNRLVLDWLSNQPLPEQRPTIQT